MRLWHLGLLSLMCFPALANTIAKPPKAVIGINAGEVAKRVCYYQDQAYSEGAIITVGENALLCTAANSFETNGALKWQSLEHTPAPEQTQPKSGKRYSTK